MLESHIVYFLCSTLFIAPQKLWERMRDFSNEKDNNGAPYAVVSLLLNQLLNGQQFNVKEDEQFCHFIQTGLLHPDALTRKRAMFVLKLVVDDSLRLKNQSGNKWSNMHAFILMMETLEESQVL